MSAAKSPNPYRNDKYCDIPSTIEKIFKQQENILNFYFSFLAKKFTKHKQLYRSHEYCEIPICDKLGTTLNQYDRLIIPDPIKEIYNTLSCGCLAFEYRSHLSNCKFYNEIEDQPYYPGCLS